MNGYLTHDMNQTRHAELHRRASEARRSRVSGGPRRTPRGRRFRVGARLARPAGSALDTA